MSAFTRQLTQLNTLVAGLQASPPPNLTQIAVGGQVYPLADFVTKAKSYESTLAAVPQAAAVHVTALQARHQAEDEITRFIHETHLFFKSALGRTNPALAAFGVAPDKLPPPLTGEQRVARAEKAAATRKARGTLGKKQRKAIHGQVPPPTPPAGPTSPASPAAPAK